MTVVIAQVEKHPCAGLVLHPGQVPSHFRKELPLGGVRGFGQQVAGDQEKIRSLPKGRLDQLLPLGNELVRIRGEEESGHGLIQFANAAMEGHRALAEFTQTVSFAPPLTAAGNILGHIKK